MVKRQAPLSQPELDQLRESSDSLRERVYQYITEGMAEGRLKPGEFLDQEPICKKFNVSKAPLRDALIRLETEGFITIIPRLGIYINHTTVEFIKSAYQTIGSLEADVLDEVFHKLPEHVGQFEESNARQKIYLDSQDFASYYKENIDFHNIFLNLSENTLIQGIINPLRRRLYDFPRRCYAYEWEEFHLKQHERFIESVSVGNKTAAISIFRFEHWSFELHKPFLNSYYSFDGPMP